jgi:K+-sensing histidine kinase KdpD
VICSELKTPVSGILGFTEILNENPVSSENKDIIETIIFASKNLKEYADTALLITQIEPEQINDNMRPTKLSSLVDYALSETMQEFSKKEIEIRSNLGDELTEIIIEPGLIKDVIQIILSDAATNSPSNGAITINLTEFTNKIALEISDQGRGFSAEMLRNIQDFLQQDVHSFRSEWAGMHFAIIKFIMHIHQAQVQVENCKNGGSLIRLIFPVNLSKGKILHQALSQLN